MLPAITMLLRGGKNSCLWTFNRQHIASYKTICGTCQFLGSKTRAHFTKHEVAKTGVCHTLYPPPTTSTDSVGISKETGTQEEGAMVEEIENNQEEQGKLFACVDSNCLYVLLSGTSSLKGRGLGATRRFSNNPLSRAIQNDEAKTQSQRLEQQRRQQCPPPYEQGQQRIFGILHILNSCFQLLLNIALLPKTVFCHAFQKTVWSPTERTILITRASSGIGAELARQYAIEGARLALVARTEEDLERVAKEWNNTAHGL
jgi:hypothetical protein